MFRLISAVCKHRREAKNVGPTDIRYGAILRAAPAPTPRSHKRPAHMALGDQTIESRPDHTTLVEINIDSALHTSQPAQHASHYVCPRREQHPRAVSGL